MKLHAWLGGKWSKTYNKKKFKIFRLSRVPGLPPVENGRSLLPIERGAADVISKLGVLVHGGQVTRVEQNVEALKDNGTGTVTA